MKLTLKASTELAKRIEADGEIELFRVFDENNECPYNMRIKVKHLTFICAVRIDEMEEEK